jgi:Cytosine/adenosine deaminases
MEPSQNTETTSQVQSQNGTSGYNPEFMKIAAEEALKGMRCGDGGPFGAVIVKDGKIIAQGHNMVIKTHDPTAHAEVTVIRKACAALERFDISDCEIYSSCEPCPMCFAAIHWAKMTKLYYGCTRKDAADIGFDDNFIYDVINGKAEKLQVELEQRDRDICMTAFEAWTHKDDRVQY